MEDKDIKQEETQNPITNNTNKKVTSIKKYLFIGLVIIVIIILIGLV